MKNILLKGALALLLVLVTVTGQAQAPTISSYDPIPGATGVASNKVLSLTFSENIQFVNSLDEYYITVMNKTTNAISDQFYISGGVGDPGLNISGSVLSIDCSDFIPNNDYYVLIDANVIVAVDDNSPFGGISLQTQWFFKAADPSKPLISSYDPTRNAFVLEQSKVLKLYFDQNIAFNTIFPVVNKFVYVKKASDDSNILVFRIRKGTPPVTTTGSGSLSISNNCLTIVNNNLFLTGVEYYVSIDNGAIESATYGNVYPFDGLVKTSSNDWHFTIIAPPFVLSNDPLDNATDIAIDKTLAITFSEPIVLTGSGLIYVKNLTNGNNFDIYDNLSPELSISGSTLSINPTGTLANSTEYQVTIESDFVASVATGATNAEIAAGEWTFTTVAPPSPITTLTPADASTNISIDTDVSIDFDQPVRYIDNSSIASNPSYLIVSFTGADGHTLTAADYLIEVNATNDGATLTLLTQLHENVLYTVVVRQVENSNDIAQSGDYTSTFKTALSAKWLGLSSAWDVTSNWSTSLVPDNTTSVVIQKAGSYDPIIANNVAADINNMTINADASLTIDASLRVREGLTLKSSASKNASLLNNGTLTVTSSKVKIQQVVTNPAWDYYISSPVNGATPAKIGFVGTVYERLANSWSTVGSSTTLTNAKGYVGIPTSATTLVYKGTINNGSYSFTGQRTTSPNNFGWSLAGNPYPCSIDWQSASLTKTNLTNGFWVYLNDSQRWGTYGGDADLGVNVDELAPSLIPSGHAFYVQVIIGQTSGTLGIAPGSRVNNTVSYLKVAENSVAKPVLRLEGVNGGLKDELAVAFIDGAADTFDSFDSQKQTSSNPDLLQVFTLAGTTRCAINSFSSSSLASSNTISLGYTASVAGTFNLLLKSITGFPDNVIVSLEDTQKGVIQEVSSGDSYSFTTTAKTDVTRFKIHLSQAVATDVPSNNEMSEKISTYVSDHILFVKVSTTESTSYELIDANGQLVSGGNLLPDTFNRIMSSKNGVFILKVITNQGVYCKKVLIN